MERKILDTKSTLREGMRYVLVISSVRLKLPGMLSLVV